MTAQPTDRIPASGPDTGPPRIVPYGSHDRRRLRIGRYR